MQCCRQVSVAFVRPCILETAAHSAGVLERGVVGQQTVKSEQRG
jgi:hypothetical protein